MIDRRRAFTLVELLVVLTVIAILVGLFLTGLRGARQSAQRADCRTRMKSAYVLLTQYADAHDGKYPTSGSSGDADTDWQNATERNSQTGLLDKLGINTARGDAEMFFCPNAESMQTYARNDTDYRAAGERDSIVYTEDNLADDNWGYLYWNFGAQDPLVTPTQYGSGWYGNPGATTAVEREAYAPRLLRAGLGATDGRTGDIISEATSRIWVLSDWFRELDGDRTAGVFPHGRGYGKGLNVLFLDGHAAEHFGTPYGVLRDNGDLPFYE
jgi:prepilin-type N-terminal cleavage/methylation domain-containing protein/prepilin-type processing-associated H-X9-DG protein